MMIWVFLAILSACLLSGVIDFAAGLCLGLCERWGLFAAEPATDPPARSRR